MGDLVAAAIEALAHQFQFVRGDARSVILDADLRLLVVVDDRYPDHRVSRAELERVFEQVADREIEQRAVDGNAPPTNRGGKRDAARVKFATDVHRDVGQRGLEVDPVIGMPVRAGVEPRYGEQLLDQPRRPIHPLQHLVQGGIPHPGVDGLYGHLRLGPKAGQRRPHLMRRVRQEASFVLPRGDDLLEQAVQGVDQRTDFRRRPPDIQRRQILPHRGRTTIPWRAAAA